MNVVVSKGVPQPQDLQNRIFSDQTIQLESYRFQTAWGGGMAENPTPIGLRCSGHFEAKVANETTHNLGVADQKILSD